MYQPLIAQLREVFASNGPIALHPPHFNGNEKRYLTEAIDSTFVSSVGPMVEKFEQAMARQLNAAFAVATVNGTAALHVALLVAGVSRDSLVITQPLTFVATCNAIRYCGADPVFIDINRQTLGLDPAAVEHWLSAHAFIDDQGQCRHKISQRKIAACVPMHTFGMPVEINALTRVCDSWRLPLVEDAAESLGSRYQGRAMGTFGRLSALSFNGNKIITTGGGGMVIAQTPADAARVKHLTTTAKTLEDFAMFHTELGFNYRMPNINAALGLAQLEQLDQFLERKQQLAIWYKKRLPEFALTMIDEPDHCSANFWLITALCHSKQERDQLLLETHTNGIETRPAWALMHRLPMYAQCQHDGLTTAENLAERLINLPS